MLVCVFLIVTGVLSRTLFSRNFADPILPLFGNNFELVTVTSVLAGYILGIRWGFIVPLSIMAISDQILGNNAVILVFTWTGFVIPAFLGGLLKKLAPKISSKFMFGGVGSSLLSTVFFFVWTNFAVWFFWYERTWTGLVRCFVAALPFFRNQFAGNMIISALVFAVILAIHALISAFHAGNILPKIGRK